jgi:hypothetical protein
MIPGPDVVGSTVILQLVKKSTGKKHKVQLKRADFRSVEKVSGTKVLRDALHAALSCRCGSEHVLGNVCMNPLAVILKASHGLSMSSGRTMVTRVFVQCSLNFKKVLLLEPEHLHLVCR